MTYEGNCRLGDLFDRRNEKGRPGLPLLSVTLANGLVDRDTLERRQESSLSPQEHLLVKPGDIAYNTMRMWQGAYGLVDREGLVSPAYVVLSPKSSVDSEYAAQLLRTPRMLYLLWAYSYGLTDDRLRLYFEDFASIPVTVPRLDEQKKIASLLRRWDESAAVLSRLADNAQLEKRALLHKLLPSRPALVSKGDLPASWKVVRLGDVVKVNPSRPPRPRDGRVTFLPMEAVSEQGQASCALIRDYDEVYRGHPGFVDGDLLVAKITPCFENGKGALVTDLANGVGFGSTEFHILRPAGTVQPRLIAQVLQSNEFRKRGSAEMEGSAGQKRVSSDFIRSFRFVCPTDSVRQHHICDLLEAADRIALTYRAAEKAISDEKRALSSRVLLPSTVGD
jgi:type I restriction enzyme S subunit